jgi:hypothetical protein
MEEYYKFVYDETEVKRFYDLIVEPMGLDPWEVYYFSLSARNKALTKEEREEYHIGRSEMIEKTIIRKTGYNEFIKKIYSKEMNKKGLLTKNGMPYPEKSLRLYWNLNPSNCEIMLKDMTETIFQIQSELYHSAISNSKEGLDHSYYILRKLPETQLSSLARNTTRHYWLDYEMDIDFEITSMSDYDTFIENAKPVMRELFGEGNSYIITSPGGLHFPIKHQAIARLGKKLNEREPFIMETDYGYIVRDHDPNQCFIYSILEIIKSLKTFKIDEFIRNKNEMITMPGTYCYNKKGELKSPKIIEV